MSKKGKTFSFLGGALVGLGLGFLFAPKSGSETRKELANQISNLWDKVRKLDANEIKENIYSFLISLIVKPVYFEIRLISAPSFFMVLAIDICPSFMPSSRSLLSIIFCPNKNASRAS